jgi:hypothetical protein
MKGRCFLAFAAFLPLLSSALVAQQPGPPRPVPTIPTGPSAPMPPAPGQFTPPDPCQDFSNQPVMTLSLSPAEIYREDAITATWDVRDRRPQVQWAYPVHIETFGAQPPFRDPTPLRGSHTFTTPSVSGRVTLQTRCGEKHVDWVRIPDAFLEAVSPERGAVGSTVTLRGSQFGGQRGHSVVEIISGGQTRNMTPTSWGNTQIDATVPNGTPTGQATIRVVKGGRRPTLGRNFRVVRTVAVNNALVSLAFGSLGLSPSFLHLTDGANASTLTLPAGLGGPATLTFTIPDWEANVPKGEKIAQTLLLPGTGFPERIRYYVHDFNTNGAAASVSGGQLVIAVTFESGGAEIKGKVRWCDVGAFGACASASWRDSLAPDIQIDNARVTMRLTPGMSAGALTFPSGQVSFDASVQIGSDFANWIVPGLRGYAGQLKTAVGNGVSARLNTAGVRNAIAAAVMGRLSALGVQNIISVTPAGNQINVEYE